MVVPIWLAVATTGSVTFGQSDPIASPASDPTSIVFADTEFFEEDWSSEVFFQEGDPIATAIQVASGGNEGAFRQMTHTLPLPSVIAVFHFRPDWTIPADTAARIERIDFARDIRVVQPDFTGAETADRFAVRQAGIVFVSSENQNTASTSWVRRELVGFTLEDGLTTIPAFGFPAEAAIDLSPGAPPIDIGFYRANSRGSAPGPPRTFVHAIDNYALMLTLAPPASCNAADLAEPFGVLNSADISAFTEPFLTGCPLDATSGAPCNAADLVRPFGTLDSADISAFTGPFLMGCP